ncbi:SEC-C domain-containing protein [Shewanella frigidimarina]|uniref:SEC-C domain-containing protein n=1 Tax=Shewanella frigidimarina TaxID=56812 RepID=UPI00317CF53E
MNGYTKEEMFLNSLGDNSFLKFWSWPNLFRDQGGKGDGKEICDLTVIFGNDILLFSDKKIDFNTTKEINVAWSRWARRAIGDSVKQIKGARRWLSEYPERVFLDTKCEHKLPIKIPSKDNTTSHNIVVCHGIEEILSSYNTESSFIFNNSIVGDAHWDKNKCRPFQIGQIFEGDFVHVFNESTIELVLKEFDTTKDFISYISQREILLSSKKSIKISCESDIIQLFYENFNDELGDRSIWSKEFEDTENIIIDKGGVAKLFFNTSFIEKKQEDKISYFWDDLIGSFSFHILNNSTEHKSWEHPSEIEPSIRYMAETGRFERRILATSFIEFYEKALPGQRGTRLCFNPINKSHVYLFLVVPFESSFPSYEIYKEMRRQMLHDYCIINKLLDPKIEYIVGISCKTRIDKQPLSPDFFNEGQDFMFIDVRDWGDTEIDEAQKIHDEYVAHGLLANRKLFMENVSEFPEATKGFRKKIDVKGKDRNLQCLCGSGKKIKKCCGR